jgi:uncharacterized membrane protein YphA (DoxX/SURF4 family)
MYLADWEARTPGTWAMGLFALTTGALILIGLLTPIASILMGLAGAGVALYRFRSDTPVLFDSWPTTFFMVIIATAIGFLGPGAFSLDSYLFGRREIIIPPTVRSPKS